MRYLGDVACCGDDLVAAGEGLGDEFVAKARRGSGDEPDKGHFAMSMRLLTVLLWFLKEVVVMVRYGIEPKYIYLGYVQPSCLLALLVSPKPIGTVHSAQSES